MRNNNYFQNNRSLAAAAGNQESRKVTCGCPERPQRVFSLGLNYEAFIQPHLM